MLDTIQNAVTEAGKNLFITLPKLTSEEVVNIWDTVSEFVEKQLSMNKGVQIPGLGTFSFLREKLQVGSNRSIFLQRPVFLLSEKLAQIHGLKFNKIRIPGDIPIVQLNFIVLSLDGPFNRDTVEGCVRETLLSFSRSIATKQTVEFTFKGIGVLIIRDNKVKMKFYKDFLHTMDGSGTLLKALTNRPGTVDSVLSTRDTSTPPFCPSNTAVFPRLEVKEMETIAEEGEKSSREQEQLDKESSKKENVFSKRFLSRQAIFPAKVTGISLTEELEKNLKPKPPPSSRQQTTIPEALKTEQEASHTQTPASRSQTSSPICDEHGRAGQTLMIRDWWMCMIISVMFECLEYSLEHQLPNFSECWWDHWIMDVILCNGLGIYCGMKTLGWLSLKTYKWQGLWNIPTYKGKMKRIAFQFTPYSWVKFEWKPASSLRRWLAVCGIIFIFLLAELNTFYLKFVLWMPPEHYLVLLRLVFYVNVGGVAMREIYDFMDDPKFHKKLGQQAWLVAAITATEFLIVIKYDPYTLTLSLPFYITQCWILGIMLVLAWTVWRFFIHDITLRCKEIRRQKQEHKFGKEKYLSNGDRQSILVNEYLKNKLREKKL